MRPSTGALCAAAICALGLGLAAATPAQADPPPWSRGGHHHHHRDGWHDGWGPRAYGPPPVVYYAPPPPRAYYAPPPVVYAPPPVYPAPGINVVVPLHFR